MQDLLQDREFKRRRHDPEWQNARVKFCQPRMHRGDPIGADYKLRYEGE